METEFTQEPLDVWEGNVNAETQSPYNQSSAITVFTLWNTLICATVVTIPWAMQQSGLILGMFEIVVIGALACYTCSIAVRLGISLHAEDISDLIKAMWGKWGQRTSLAMSIVLLLGALMACNVILNSSLYAALDGISIWISGQSIGNCTGCWSSFSSRYSPLILLVILTSLLNMKEKKSYVSLNSFGAYFVIPTVIFLCVVGIRALVINSWTTHGSASVPDSHKRCSGDWNCVDFKYEVHVKLFGNGFFVAAGVMTLSYFVHNSVVILLKHNAPKKNTRDLVLGYFITGVCYFAIGVLGYFGFVGNGFPQGAIAQNALDMFQATNPFAFSIRVILVLQMLTIYPMLAFVIRAQLFIFLYGKDFPSRKLVIYFSLAVSGITTLVTIVYPNVGTIVAFFGAVCGFYFIYLTPVCLRFKLKGRTCEESIGESSIEAWRPSRASRALHMMIPLLGLVILVFQFVPPENL